MDRGRGFDSNYQSIMGTFDHFNGLSNKFVISESFYKSQIPCSGAFEQKIIGETGDLCWRESRSTQQTYGLPPPRPLPFQIMATRLANIHFGMG